MNTLLFSLGSTLLQRYLWNVFRIVFGKQSHIIEDIIKDINSHHIINILIDKVNALIVLMRVNFTNPRVKFDTPELSFNKNIPTIDENKPNRIWSSH